MPTILYAEAAGAAIETAAEFMEPATPAVKV